MARCDCTTLPSIATEDTYDAGGSGSIVAVLVKRHLLYASFCNNPSLNKRKEEASTSIQHALKPCAVLPELALRIALYLAQRRCIFSPRNFRGRNGPVG